MAEHNILTGVQLHEPKHFKEAVADDAGKVLTPSDVDGVSELRVLTNSEVGVPDLSLLNAHGSMVIKQNTNSQTLGISTLPLYNETEYVPILNDWVEGSPGGGVDFSAGTLTIPVSGYYQLHAWLTFTYSATDTLLGFRSTIDGVVPVTSNTVRQIAARASDVNVVTAGSIGIIPAGTVLGLAVAASKAGDLIITDSTVALHLIEAVET